MLFYYNEEGIENGVYTDSEDGLNHKAIEDRLDGNEANADEIEAAQDAEFSPENEGAFINHLMEAYMPTVPRKLNLHRKNMILENGVIKDCSFLVTEAMCEKYCYDAELIESAALLEGARLDLAIRNLVREGYNVDEIKRFIDYHRD